MAITSTWSRQYNKNQQFLMRKFRLLMKISLKTLLESIMYKIVDYFKPLTMRLWHLN